jgi:uncharacterized protein (TIGR02145 family)
MKKLILCLLLLAGCKEDDSPVTPGPSTVTDIDGNAYHTVTIGTQVWMVENLKVTKYNDGTPIPLVSDSVTWSNLSTPGYCWYNNDAIAYKDTYGALYNWNVIKTGKLPPAGWHVPTDSEWTLLAIFLGGDSLAGGKMKEAGTVHWSFPNTGADNSSSFTALPGGYRRYNATFKNIGIYGIWWSSTQLDAINAWGRYVYYGNAESHCHFSDLHFGLSVRCVRD